jgi:hypothetical protein
MSGESEQFQKVLAAALRLSAVDRLRFVARIADSLAEDLEKSQRNQPPQEILWQGLINENHQLIVHMPEGFPPCTVHVVIEWPTETELKDITADQLKITIRPPNTEAIRQWFANYQLSKR